MDAQEEGLPENADAAARAERRSGGDRRLSGRRRSDRSAADPAPDPRAEVSGAGLASAWVPGAESLPRAPSESEWAVARRFHFRSFDDRRLGVERRAAPSADDGRLTTDEVASLLRQED